MQLALSLPSFLVGAVLGAGACWFWLKGRPGADGAAGMLRDENTALQVRIAALEAGKAADQRSEDWIALSMQQLRDTFEALAARALKENSGQVLAGAGEQLVKPLEKVLRDLGEQVKQLEQRRESAYGALGSQLDELRKDHSQLHATTLTLTQALRSSSVRGRWGEVALQRIVELAGLKEGLHFDVQTAQGDARPDMVVHLPHGGSLPIDAKAPMASYLEAQSAPDEAARRARLDEHAVAMRQRIRELGDKAYWKQFPVAPEFVVMFVPSEPVLGAAFEARPDLLEYAIELRVMPVTPVTLLALLKAVAYGWQQQVVAENIKLIQDECREFHKRLVPFIRSLAETGKGLDKAVEAFNATVGSFEGRVLPMAQRLERLGAGGGELPEPRAVDRRVRAADAERAGPPELNA